MQKRFYRWLLWSWVFALAACGGAQRNSVGSGADDLESPTATDESTAVWEWMRPVQGPSTLRLRLARLTLNPGAQEDFSGIRCMDRMVYVLEGSVSLIAPPDVLPAEILSDALEVGDAYRVSGRASLALEAGAEGASLLVAYVYASDVAATTSPEQAPHCDTAGDSFVAQRALVQDVPELVVAGGKLRVRIYFDEAQHQARWGGLGTVHATPELNVPEHVHEASAEILYVLEGDGRMRLGDNELQVRPGAFLYIPPNTLHDYRSAGTSPLRAIQFYTPSGPEQRFRSMN